MYSAPTRQALSTTADFASIYGTNDHQEYEAVGDDGKNGYAHIKSIVMLSTDDMVNWEYHGFTDVAKIAPDKIHGRRP